MSQQNPVPCCEFSKLEERIEKLEEKTWCENCGIFCNKHEAKNITKKEWPQKGDDYFHIDQDLSDTISDSIWDNDGLDEYRRSFLGIYRKRETAEAVRDFIKGVMIDLQKEVKNPIRITVDGKEEVGATTMEFPVERICAAIAKDKE